ncbi:hypothetical protein SSBR45G_57670 [Bradyrhizobium sp. SSBR45G]|nr:hypothetical protein SSBR45G_57670 [Bradyrhizobium sp. SSBR45G]GLH88330.1 hypothetical protein SSBR45R_57910 [Bradyrhizobium sp. SSBR45R]
MERCQNSIRFVDDPSRHTNSVSRRITRPSFAEHPPSSRMRAQGRPGAGRARGPPAKKMQAAGTTGLADYARPSLRDGLDGCSVLSPGTGVLAPVIRNIVVTDLASASGCQDHTA